MMVNRGQMAAAFVVVLAGALTAQDMSKVANTPHNLNTVDVWGVVIPQNRVCLPCHTSHNALNDEAGQSQVLWNHAMTDQTFEMYTTSAGHQGGQPEGTSKLCLSCHDGATAIDSFGGNNDFFNNVRIPVDRPSNLGTDLRDDHPIGVTYPPPDLTGYHDKSTFTGVKVVTINGTDRVECTSCHDPHDNSLGMFLRQTLDGSALCLECHDE
jgi:predicted CXXCH cytochrome family protein